MRALLSRASKDRVLPADSAADAAPKDARPTLTPLRSFVSAFKAKDFLRPPPLSAASSSSSSDASSLNTPTDDLVPDADSPERAKYTRKASSSAASTSSASSKRLKRVRSFFANKAASASIGRSGGKSVFTATDDEVPPVPPLPESLALRPLTPPPPHSRTSGPIPTPPAHPSDPPPPERLPPGAYVGRAGSVAARVPYPHPRHIPVLIQTITRASLPPHTSPHPLLIHPPNTQLFPGSTRRLHPSRVHSHTSSPTLRRLFKFSVLARLQSNSHRPLTPDEHRELAHLSFRGLPAPGPTAQSQAVSTSGDLPPTRIKTCSTPPGVREFLRRESFHKRMVHWVWVEYDEGIGRWEEEEVLQSRGLRVNDTRDGCSPGIKALAKGLEYSDESESSEEDEEEGDTSDGAILGLRSIELKSKANGGKLLPPATITKAPSVTVASVKSSDSYERERRKSTGASQMSPRQREHHPGPPPRSHTDPLPANAHLTTSPPPPVPPLPGPNSSPNLPLAQLGTPGSSINPRVPASASLAMQSPAVQRELDWIAVDEKRRLKEKEEERERWKKAVVQARERSERERRGERGALEDLREGEGWDANNGKAKERARSASRSELRAGERERSRAPASIAGSSRESRRSTIGLARPPSSSISARAATPTQSTTGSLSSRTRPASMMFLPSSPSVSLSQQQQGWMPMPMMPVMMPVAVPVLVEPAQQQQQQRASTMPRNRASWAPQAPPSMPGPPLAIHPSLSLPSTPSMPLGFGSSPSQMHLQAAAAAQMHMRAAAAAAQVQLQWQMAAAAHSHAGAGSAGGSERMRQGRRQTVDFSAMQQGSGSRR